MIRRVLEAIREKEFTPRGDVVEPSGEPFDGWKNEWLGGGGGAWALHFDDGGWVWITDGGGVGLPEPDGEVTIGVYPASAREDDTGEVTLVSYKQAVDAAKALLPAKNFEDAFSIMKKLGLMVDNP